MIRRISYVIWVLILLGIGGLLGTVTWLITGGAAAYAGYLYGGAAATATAGIVGKATSYWWVKGMTQVAQKHCPRFHSRMERLWNFWKKYWSEILIALFWITFIAWVIVAL